MKPEDPDFPHEEYAILTATTAPGTARRLLKCGTASTGTEVAIADLLCDTRPSGVVLPEMLRRKLRLMNKATVMMTAPDEYLDPISKDDGGNTSIPNESSTAAHNFLQDTFRTLNNMEHVTLFDRVAHYDAKRLHSKSPIANIQSAFEQIEDDDKDDIEAHLPINYDPPTYRIDQNRIFTTTELEKKISRANAALLDIQKQLIRGEEIYFQDTDIHGNIYKGWEGAFIDSKAEQLGIQDIDNIRGDDIASIVQNYSTATPTRKIHSDMRWFSSSSDAVENGNIRGGDRRKSQRSFSSFSSTVPIALPILTISNQGAAFTCNQQESNTMKVIASTPDVSSEATPPTNTESEDIDKPASDAKIKQETEVNNDMGPPEPREKTMHMEVDQSLKPSNTSTDKDESAQTEILTDTSDEGTQDKKGEMGDKNENDDKVKSDTSEEEKDKSTTNVPTEDVPVFEKKSKPTFESPKKDKGLKRGREERSETKGNDNKNKVEEVETRTSSRLRKKRK